MYNLRYHIASLVAVFLALSIGLVLGTVIIERGTFDRQRKTLVADLTKDFTSLKDENGRLKSSLDRDHAFATDAVPVLTSGVLTGRRVLVIANAGRCDGLTDLTDWIARSGGVPVVLSFGSAGFGLDDEAVAETVGTAVGRPGVAGLPKRTADVVASELATGGPRPVVAALVSAGQLTYESGTLPSHFDAVALIASFEARPDPLLVQLARGMKASGVPVLGVETTQRKTDVAPSSVEAGLSAVDHLDTPMGIVSAMWVLGSRAEGHYGIQAGAQRMYPPLAAQGTIGR